MDRSQRCPAPSLPRGRSDLGRHRRCSRGLPLHRDRARPPDRRPQAAARAQAGPRGSRKGFAATPAIHGPGVRSRKAPSSPARRIPCRFSRADATKRPLSGSALSATGLLQMTDLVVRARPGSAPKQGANSWLSANGGLTQAIAAQCVNREPLFDAKLVGYRLEEAGSIRCLRCRRPAIPPNSEARPSRSYARRSRAMAGRRNRSGPPCQARPRSPGWMRRSPGSR